MGEGDGGRGQWWGGGYGGLVRSFYLMDGERICVKDGYYVFRDTPCDAAVRTKGQERSIRSLGLDNSQNTQKA